jgi:hypothetical protein
MLALVEDLIERDRLSVEPFDACEFCLGGTPGNEKCTEAYGLVMPARC